MKVEVNKIPENGLILEETLDAQGLDIQIEGAKFIQPIRVRAQVSKVNKTVLVDLNLDTVAQADCSRCLSTTKQSLNKNIFLNYSFDKPNWQIDLSPEIREEIIIDFPLKPLCRPDCKGLCPKCGKNLNEDECNC